MALLTIAGLTHAGCKRERIEPRATGSVEKARVAGTVSDDLTFVCGIGPTAEYPGGQEAWSAYLRTDLHYPEEAIAKNIEGAVNVRFVIELDGRVSNAEAVSGPDSGGLRNEAVRAIRGSVKWTPEFVEGRAVKSWRVQPVVFKLTD